MHIFKAVKKFLNSFKDINNYCFTFKTMLFLTVQSFERLYYILFGDSDNIQN